MRAQTFTTLRSLGSTDGGQPLGALTLSGNTLYGTTSNGGGSSNGGTVFAINTDGTGFRVVHTFSSVFSSTDGSQPGGGVVLSGKTLFGTTAGGGASSLGTVYAVNNNGTGFTLLHFFGGGGQGAAPEGGLVLSGNTLYGTAHFSSNGSSTGDGLVFAVNIDGTGFRIVHNFTAASDGAHPAAGLILSGNILYGTASDGGSVSNGGTVFAVNTDGTGFTVLHRFGGSDGFDPEATLALAGNTLYGTTVGGGNGNGSRGAIFAVNIDGTGFNVLHSFIFATDGSHPRAGLTLSGNALYGTTTSDGPSSGGTIFAVNTDGTNFTVLHPFTFGSVDGFNPGADLILSAKTFYGTTEVGGNSNIGTVFSLSFTGVISPLFADSTIGQLLVYQIVANNSPTSYSATNLPPGLTINTTNGVIGGVPTQPGVSSVTISATGVSGTTSAVLNLNINPQPASGPVITSTSSATGRTGQFFAFQVLARGATAAARAGIAAATDLPPGLHIDDVSGLISGTPTMDGSFAVNLTITDGPVVATQVLELTFTSDPAIPVITSPSTAALTPGQPFSYTIVAPTVTGPSDQTVFNIIGTLPAGLGFDPATATISGTPTSRPQRIHTLTPLIRALDDTPVVGVVQLVASNAEGTGTKPLVFVPPASNPLFNISTRLQVGTGDNVLIGGFVVSGTEPKRVVLRAIGGSLSNFNVPDVLANPTIDIFDKNGKISTDDNWADSQKDDLIAAGYAPTDGLESAVLMVLNPGAYTAIVRGNANTTGVALVELFDLTPVTSSSVTSSSVANISTRGFVQSGDNVMIGGFIVGPNGTGTAKVLVRAIGPSLADFNVPNVLSDPTLEIHDGTGAIVASNDNWKDTQQSEIQLTGLAPKNGSESAIVSTLTSGAYTAIVRGKVGATGVALVEVYALQ